VIRRIAIGENPEFLRVFGDQAYVTYEPAVADGPPKPGQGKLSGPPAAIAVIDLKTWRVERVLPSGQEAEGTEFSPDGRTMLVANEGDNTIAVYELPSGKRARTVKTTPHGERPRGIKVSPDGEHYVVTLEGSDKLLILDRHLKVERLVDTAKTPYGLAFDPAGKRLFVVAAKAKQLQVFDAKRFSLLTSVPLGDRCWHFSMTQAGERLLVACGRSHDIHVINAKTYAVEKVIPGFKLPWGIVTYPTAMGSLDVQR
jgi:YVTN family beta-propeller protein